MESYEVLRKAFKPVGCKRVAQELQVSLSLVHQWSRGHHGQSDAMNPLERTAQLVALTGNDELLEWLCAQRGGFFVKNTAPKPSPQKLELIAAECELVKDCGALLAESFQAVAAKDLSPAKVSLVRANWEKLKAVAERFVRLLEAGRFRRQLWLWFPQWYLAYDVATPGGLI